MSDCIFSETPAKLQATEFRGMPKLARLFRNVTVTEKINGTNSGILIGELPDDFPDATLRTPEGLPVLVASRNKWITPENDNAGFARWVWANIEELSKLGPGHHLGEWWGQGIQCNYGLKEKRWSLFNTFRWSDDAVRPKCCYVVPVLWRGPFSESAIDSCLGKLASQGSEAAPGFMDPEGVVIYHEAAKTYFKVTIKNDESPKSLVE